VASANVLQHHHDEWQPGQAWIAADSGAGRRSAKNAAAPIKQSREAHRSPEAAAYAPCT